MPNFISFKKCLLSAIALSTLATVSIAETYALSIGINDYPESKDAQGQVVDSDLKGCVNDAKALQNLFVTKFGVKSENTRIITDKKVTFEAFLDNMKWLLSSAKAGDQVVFTYSGHGGQVKDATEPDGFEEVLVLADENLIPGDLFGEIAKLLSVNGIHSTFIFDSCFSGGMSRNVDGKISVRNKSLGEVRARRSATLDSLQKSGVKLTPRQAGGTAATSAFLFASQEDKTSSDISGLEGIDPHGIFTLLLLAVLEDNPKTPVAEMYDSINAVLDSLNESFKKQGSDMKFEQNPKFETTGDRASLPILLGL